MRPSSEYRITLFDTNGEPIGLNATRVNNQGPGIPGRFGPMTIGDKPSAQEQPLVWNDFAGGMGAGHVYAEAMYAWTINGYCRSPKMFMPAGMLIEITLPEECTDDSNTGGVIAGGFVWERKEAKNPWADVNINDDLIIFCGRYMLKFDNMGRVESSMGVGKVASPTIIFDAGSRKQLLKGVMYTGFPIVTQMNIDKPDSWLPVDRALLFPGTDGTTWYDTYYAAGRAQSWPSSDQVTRTPMVGEHIAKVYMQADKNIGGSRLIVNDSPYTFAQISTASRDELANKQGWNDLNPIGEPTATITNIVASNWHAYFCKTDGVYDVVNEGQYTPNLTPTWKTNPHYMNGRAAIWHDGFLYAGMIKGIDRVDTASQMRIDVPTLVNPGAPGMPSNETPVNGIYWACTTDAGWLVFGVYNGKDSHIMYGQDREKLGLPYKGPGPMIWHGSECTIPNERITMLMTTAKGTDGECGMWIGTLDVNLKPHLYWLSLPRSGNPLQDYLTRPGKHIFRDEAQLYLPIDDWRFPGAMKTLRRMTVTAENLTATVLKRLDDNGELIDVPDQDAVLYDESELIESPEIRSEIDVLANMDVGARSLFDDANRSRELYWRLQGTATESPRASFVPAIRESKGYQVALMLRGRLAHQENPNHHPFIMRGVEVAAQVIHTLLPQKRYTVMIAKDASTLSGGRDPRHFQVTFEQLAALQTAGPIDMIDEFGQRLQVVIEPGIEWNEIPEREGQPWTYSVQFTVTVLARPFYYDTEATYDSIFIWS